MTFIPDKSFSIIHSISLRVRNFDFKYNFERLRLELLRIKNRFSPDTYTLNGLTINYRDALSLYMELKDIFFKKIYHFDTSNKKPIIIDGGGFIGASILYFKSTYPKSKIITFEPDRLALSYLYENIKTNHLTNIEVHEKALSNKKGHTYFDATGTDSSRIDPKAGVKIDTVKLSSYIDQEIDFVKLNIEGAELSVFQDLDHTGKIKKVKKFCFEWHSFAHQQQNLDQILAILRKNGFKYLISSVDPVSNPLVFPPFHLKKSSKFYLLVYAQRLEEKND